MSAIRLSMGEAMNNKPLYCVFFSSLLCLGIAGCADSGSGAAITDAAEGEVTDAMKDPPSQDVASVADDTLRDSALPSQDLGIVGADSLPEASSSEIDAQAALSVDGNGDHLSLDTAGPVLSCAQDPKEGDRCSGIPEGYVCRQGDCVGGCVPECSCEGGTWRCPMGCRDFTSQSPDSSVRFCGVAPLCWARCYATPPVRDGGEAFSD